MQQSVLSIRSCLWPLVVAGLFVTLAGCNSTGNSDPDTALPDSPSAAQSHPQTAASSIAPGQSVEPDAGAVSRSAAFTSSGGDNSNLLLGNPSGANGEADNRLVERPQFALSYNKNQGGPNWVSWHVQVSDLGRVGRGSFWPDPLLPSDSQIRPNDYRGSGYDRGHQCPSGDRTSSRQNNDATFVMSNMLPQAPALNQGVWAKLENYCRDQVRAGNELYILCGGAGTQGRIDGGKINVPKECWKLIVVLPQGDDDLRRITPQTRVIAVSMPNLDSPEVGGARWASFLTTPAAIESATGYTFFSNLPEGTRQALEQKRDTGRAPRGSGASRNPDSSPVSDAPDEGSENAAPNRVAVPGKGMGAPTTQSTPPREAPAFDSHSSSEQPASSTGTQVWVNTNSGVYHYPGTRWYGATKRGEYMSEQEALAQGYHAAANGQ